LAVVAAWPWFRSWALLADVALFDWWFRLGCWGCCWNGGGRGCCREDHIIRNIRVFSNYTRAGEKRSEPRR
jgi:hypothetical protein